MPSPRHGESPKRPDPLPSPEGEGVQRHFMPSFYRQPIRGRCTPLRRRISLPRPRPPRRRISGPRPPPGVQAVPLSAGAAGEAAAGAAAMADRKRDEEEPMAGYTHADIAEGW